jgi:hypothetical protein
MSDTKPPRPFCVHGSDEVKLPTDVLNVLRQPHTVTTGCLLVFHTSAVAAYRRLAEVGLAPGSPLEMRLFYNDQIRVLDEQPWRFEGVVYALSSPGNGSRVVQIVKADSPFRHRDLHYAADIRAGRVVEVAGSAHLIPGPRTVTAAQLVADLWSAPIFPDTTQDRVREAIADWPELGDALDALVVEIYGRDPAQVAMGRIRRRRGSTGDR